MSEKTCKDCQLTLPLARFYGAGAYKGRAYWKSTCRDCDSRRYHLRRRYRETGDRIRARERVRSKLPHRSAMIRAAAARWRVKYPERHKAQQAFGRAVRAGKIKREPCLVCGAPRTHGHHLDYSRPFDVIFLCPLHHFSLAHPRLKALGGLGKIG